MSAPMSDAERALLGRWVRWHRVGRGWSQEELAVKASRSLASVQNLEYGKHGKGRAPSTLPDVERALGLDQGALLSAVRAGQEPGGQEPKDPLLEDLRAVRPRLPKWTINRILAARDEEVAKLAERRRREDAEMRERHLATAKLIAEAEEHRPDEAAEG